VGAWAWRDSGMPGARFHALRKKKDFPASKKPDSNFLILEFNNISI
jgi:hypothetical protein